MNATEPSSSQPAAGRLGLPSAIRAATHRALAARDQRLQEYPHWEEWRRQGRELKAAAQGPKELELVLYQGEE